MDETYWKIAPADVREYPALNSDIRCSCLIIGGGLCGMTAAYLLGQRGIDTVLIEKERIGNGKTAGTTAKATVCHNTAYSDISEKLGAESARKYAAANLAGLKLLQNLSGEYSCDARTADMYLYSIYGERRIWREYIAMRDIGIDCELIKEDSAENYGFELPVKIKSAVRIKNQLAFHPMKLLHGIVEHSKAKIYEQTEAVGISSGTHHHIVKVKNGHTISAGKVIIATNYPVLVPKNLNFIKLYRETSYAAAVKGLPTLSGMYYGIDGGYAYRSHEDVLIVSGERHRGAASGKSCEKLVEQARALFGTENPEVTAAWSNNDCYTHDGVPYVGSIGDGIFIASGFSAWGMTNSAAAAIILSHLTAGEKLWYADIFNPSRNVLKSGGESLYSHIAVSVGGMAKNLTVPEHTVSEIAPGSAGIVSYNGRRAGAYRDNEGKVHLVSVKCPHLGCSLEWNPASLTWDCPCHGSRFSYDGKCISEPANNGIQLS